MKGWQGDNSKESSFGTWMTRIVINLCLDRLDINGGALNPLRPWMKNPAASKAHTRPHRQPTAGLERNELRQRIDKAWATLS